WPYLAACQLWVVRVRQKRLADAESILDTLLARQPAGGFDRLAVVLPREVLEKVVGDYADAGLGVYSVYLDPQWVVRLERASEVARLLGVPWSQRGWNDLAMIRGYRMAGRTRQAVRATRERLDRDEPDSQPVGMAFLTEYGWLMRDEGKPGEGLGEMDRGHFEGPGGPPRGHVNLLEGGDRHGVARGRRQEAGERRG